MSQILLCSIHGAAPWYSRLIPITNGIWPPLNWQQGTAVTPVPEVAHLEGVPKVSPGRASRRALIEDGSQGEDVHLLIAVRPGKLLRRHVLRRAMDVCG